MARRIFLLSPANLGGPRARQLVAPDARFELAQRLRAEGAAIGEVMRFVSALYFRGKLAYAERFAAPPRRAPGVLVITPSRGLVSPDLVVTSNELRDLSSVPIDARDDRYAAPLRVSIEALRARLPRGAEVVLLGSISTPKYVDPLLATFGRSLLFPAAFVGRGDMSRGGLLLRAARAGEELAYEPLDGAVRRGARPARLPKLR